MSTSRLDAFLDRVLFVALASHLAALDRDTGETVWSWKAPKGTDQPVVLLDGDRLIVSVQGYTYCLDPMTGEQRWANQLRGFGIGDPLLMAVRRGPDGGRVVLSATKQMQRDASADTAATGAAT